MSDPSIIENLGQGQGQGEEDEVEQVSSPLPLPPPAEPDSIDLGVGDIIQIIAPSNLAIN